MPKPGTQRRTPNAKKLWSTLQNDSLAGLTLGIFAATTLVYLLPLLAPAQLVFVSRRLGPFVFLSLVVFALRWNLGRIKSREDREFWNDLLGAHICWWTAAALILFFPVPAEKPLYVDFATSLLYALYYVGILMAVERQPHRRHRWRPLALERSLAWPTATSVVVGLFLYFPFIAFTAADKAEYRSGLPDLCLYLTLDGYLALRWIYLYRVTTSPRWRVAYLLIALATSSIFLSDLIEAFALAPGERWQWNALENLLLYLPYLLLVTAARLRHHPFPWEPPPPASRIRLEENLPGPLGQTMTFVLLFPLVHFGAHEVGLLGEASRAHRELLVLIWLPILGIIGVIQYKILERALEDLKEERQSSERALHKTQKELRLAQERQMTDEVLRSGYERFSKAFRSCPDAMVVSRLEDGLLLDVNPSCERVFGYTPEEFIGRTAEQLGLWSDPEMRAFAVEELNRCGQVTLETGFRRKSGEERIGLFSARRIEIDGKPHLFSVTCDVTDAKQREKALREKVAVVEGAASAVWAVDPDGNVVFANETARLGQDLDKEAESLRIPVTGDGGEPIATLLISRAGR